MIRKNYYHFGYIMRNPDINESGGTYHRTHDAGGRGPAGTYTSSGQKSEHKYRTIHQPYFDIGKWYGRLSDLGLLLSKNKQIEKELQKTNSFIDSFMSTSQEIILLLDTEGDILRFNPHLEKISGFQLSEVKGKQWTEIFTPPDQRQRAREIFCESPLEETAESHICSIITNKGKERFIEWRGKTLKDQQGRTTALLFIGMDITEQRRAEQQRDRYHKELQKIKGRTLNGFIPICANCKTIRDQKNNWVGVETYIRERTKAEFSHTICPDCARELYPDIDFASLMEPAVDK